MCWTHVICRKGWAVEQSGIQLGCGRIVLDTDTSDYGAVRTLEFLILLYLSSCGKWFCWFLLHAIFVCSVSLSSLIVGLHSGNHSEFVTSCTLQLCVRIRNELCLRMPDQQDLTEFG